MIYPEQKHKPSTRSRLLVAFLAFLLPLFVCGGLASGYYVFDTVREYVAYGNLPDYGSVLLGSANAQGSPAVQSGPNIAAGERVNVLLLGIDKREGEAGPFRTDTMILATLDPKTKTAGMLSIPRDLYVPIPIPKVGENRINTANFFGETYKYPGGGPALAKKTVEYNLGIPVHFYVLIDFEGFKKIVDTLGGIDIDVPTPIDDPEYPTENYGVEYLHIPAGHPVHMDGDLALKYARTRHTTNDFDRSRRQMQVLLAMRDKALKLDILPKLPQLYSEFKGTIQTDLSLSQILALAPIARQIRSDNIKTRAIDQTVTYEIRLNNGADVLWPDRAKIARVVREIFPEEPTSNGDFKQENARVAVLNGTDHQGYAQQAAQLLRNQGFNVVQVANADRADYDRTVLLDNGNHPATLNALARTFGLDPGAAQQGDSSLDVDLEVIIGADWVPPSQ